MNKMKTTQPEIFYMGHGDVPDAIIGFGIEQTSVGLNRQADNNGLGWAAAIVESRDGSKLCMLLINKTNGHQPTLCWAELTGLAGWTLEAATKALKRELTRQIKNHRLV